MITLGLIYLTILAYTTLEFNLIVRRALADLRRDIQIKAQFSTACGRIESTDQQYKDGLAPYFKSEYVRALKFVFLFSLFFCSIILPAMLLDYEEFEKGFAEKYKQNAQRRILEKLK